jgi:L-amino acid N-acyltransferase YncA
LHTRQAPSYTKLAKETTMLTTERTLLCEARSSRGDTAEQRTMRIRPATSADFPAMLRIFRRVIASGDTDVHASDTSAAKADAYWFGRATAAWVAEMDGRVVGMYRLIPHQPGRGSHVADAALMVDPNARGLGVGLALGRHCLAEAKKDGYLAAQCNLVVRTNTRAVALCKKLGFGVAGTLPRAFRHARFGLVDAYVMHRSL